MDRKFNPRKYGMMTCPLCNGHGHIHYSADVRVCQNCGGFGFVRIEVETFDQKGNPIASGGSKVVKE